MRAVKATLASPLAGGVENQKTLARDNGTSRRAIRWEGEKATCSGEDASPLAQHGLRTTIRRPD
jgi:hypothetical protein